jgi:hypothetical protein
VILSLYLSNKNNSGYLYNFHSSEAAAGAFKFDIVKRIGGRRGGRICRVRNRKFHAKFQTNNVIAYFCSKSCNFRYYRTPESKRFHRGRNTE